MSKNFKNFMLGRRRFLQAAGVGSFSFFSFLKNVPAFEGSSGAQGSESLDQKPKTSAEIASSKKYAPGYLSILQGPTTETDVLINLFVPRLKKYTYRVFNSEGQTQACEKYETVSGPTFYFIDKLHITGLNSKDTYTLQVFDRDFLIDERLFKALDLTKLTPKFAMASCMCDDHRFEEVIDPMWEKLRAEQVDFLILNGDTVYVDSFEFVERQKATEFDLWQRYVDAFKRIPLYHWRELVPVFATWDDHDFGTNDGDRNFKSIQAVTRLFNAIFGGRDLAGVWEKSPSGISNKFKGFGQNFYFMDDRTNRQPNKNQTTQEPFGHWGESQHTWLIENLGREKNLSWIVNGNQFFSGSKLDFKESFADNHPAEFLSLLSEIQKSQTPVVFASGDVHLSEVMQISREKYGIDSYEFTSSSMHSFTGSGWENPLRVPGAYTREHNFLTFNTGLNEHGIEIQVRSIGLDAKPYFDMKFQVKI